VVAPPRYAPLPDLGEVLELMRLVWAIDHGLQSTSRRMESALGVTGPQRLIVKLVGRFPGMTAGQLAEALQVHPSTMTGLLARLEAKKLIERRRDSRDRRRSFLGLTAAGAALDRARVGTVEDAVARALDRLPRGKREVAAEVLRALAAALRPASRAALPAGSSRKRRKR
jgi:DNA-binding MarR family transcriptional regulator